LGDGRAQALIETALVFPILITLLIGAVDLSRVARATIAVTNAARAGAQYGGQDGFTAQDATGIATAASNDSSTLTIITTSSYACVCSNGSSSTCLNTDCSTSHMEETVTVNTQATVTPAIHLPLLPTTFTVTGQAIQRCLK
jgi:Flp pilus assembly protein TadG